MADNQDNTPEHNDGDDEHSWSRRDWIKLVGITTAGVSVLGTNPLFAQSGEDYRYVNGDLYVTRKHYAYFVSKYSLESGTTKSYGLKKTCLPVKGCRTIGKKDMIHNSAMPRIDINPETYEVKIDGKLATVEPIKELPLAQRYLLF